jgi:hypothetical protein
MAHSPESSHKMTAWSLAISRYFLIFRIPFPLVIAARATNTPQAFQILNNAVGPGIDMHQEKLIRTGA